MKNRELFKFRFEKNPFSCDKLNQILKQKLGDHIRFYSDESYICCFDQENFIGISRYVRDIQNDNEAKQKFLLDEKPTAYLCGVFVDESYRGEGIGKRLLELRIKQLGEYTLITDVRHSSSLFDLYEQHYHFKPLKTESFKGLTFTLYKKEQWCLLFSCFLV